MLNWVRLCWIESNTYGLIYTVWDIQKNIPHVNLLKKPQHSPHPPNTNRTSQNEHPNPPNFSNRKIKKSLHLIRISHALAHTYKSFTSTRRYCRGWKHVYAPYYVRTPYRACTSNLHNKGCAPLAFRSLLADR